MDPSTSTPAAPSCPIVSRVPILVRYSETDRMGIVHHGRYLEYLEVGRVDLMKRTGFSYRKTEEAGSFSPVTELWTRYWRSVTFDDALVVETWYRAITAVRLTFGYRITRAVESEGLDVSPTGELVAEAITLHARVDRTGRPAPYAPDFAETVGRNLIARDPSRSKLRG